MERKRKKIMVKDSFAKCDAENKFAKTFVIAKPYLLLPTQY